MSDTPASPQLEALCNDIVAYAAARGLAGRKRDIFAVSYFIGASALAKLSDQATLAAEIIDFLATDLEWRGFPAIVQLSTTRRTDQ